MIANRATEKATSGGTHCVLVAGASGLVGTALCEWLELRGHEVRRLVRRMPKRADEFGWDPAAGKIDDAAMIGVTAVINLAGANVAEGRWTQRRKELILRSRIDSARTLVTALQATAVKPQVLINASATGYYGDTGDQSVDESAPTGTGFLAEVCRQWEQSAMAAQDFGVRTVILRLGVVLAKEGGALAKMLPAFRLGLGGRLGTGRQWMSWIALSDLLEVIGQALDDATMRGTINAVSSRAVTNAEFTQTLARVLRRPAVLPVPAWALRLALGEMADAALLQSNRVIPARLQQRGFVFHEPELEPVLRRLLGR